MNTHKHVGSYIHNTRIHVLIPLPALLHTWAHLFPLLLSHLFFSLPLHRHTLHCVSLLHTRLHTHLSLLNPPLYMSTLADESGGMLYYLRIFLF